MEWCELLESYWRDRDLLSTDHGVDENAISAFESRYSVRMPTEARLYFQRLNGMSMLGGHDVDDNGFSFLPLAAVRSVTDFSSTMGWKIESSVGGDTAFVFVDYLQWSWAYAFETASPNSGTIYLLGYKEPKIVAPSLSKFVSLYLIDDPLLYGNPSSA